MDKTLLEIFAGSSGEIKVVSKENLDVPLSLFGTRRMLVFRVDESVRLQVLKETHAYAERLGIDYEVLSATDLTPADIRGGDELVYVDGQPFTKTVPPDYWPDKDRRKMIVVDGLDSSASTDLLQAFVHVAALDGYYDDRSHLPEDRLPDGSGFVFLAGNDFPFSRLDSISQRRREEYMEFDATGIDVPEHADIPASDEETQIERRVWEAIRKTINKFREHPYYFFTESDIVTYLCQCLYTRKLEVVRRDDPAGDGKRIYCVHREYPTNFRYEKDSLLVTDMPYPLGTKQGTRGNFDLAVINPKFVRDAPSVEDIVNKNVRDLEKRSDAYGDELLFAVEFKYVINSSRVFDSEIRKDNKKLEFALKHGAKNVVNLVFCNTAPRYEADFIEAVKSASDGVNALFVQSYYDSKGVKVTPSPVGNVSDIRALLNGAS